MHLIKLDGVNLEGPSIRPMLDSDASRSSPVKLGEEARCGWNEKRFIGRDPESARAGVSEGRCGNRIFRSSRWDGRDEQPSAIMKIVIPGGSGQVGNLLARDFHRKGHEVIVLSRNKPTAAWRTLHWDAATLGEWTAAIEGADAVINLAGRNVNCRYTSANRHLIKQSRVESTKVISEAISKAKQPPRVWLQASTATIYAHRYDAPNDERTGLLGGLEADVPQSWGFSIDVAHAWERATQAMGPLSQTRTVLLRSAMVMSPDSGGVFDMLLRLVRVGLGGRADDGRQFVSWIHEQDFINAIYWLIERNNLDGAVNLASPYPLPNIEFMAAIRKAWGMPLGMPATKWMLELGAIFLRTETELILKSRRVIPKRLLNDGFTFRFAEWPEAVQELCGRWRKNAARI
jgi:uncharacterized protein